MPPMNMRQAVVMRPLAGCPDRARAVARVGPRTTPRFMEAVSIAIAVRYCASGTAVRHIGLTARFIGGAVNPSTPAKMMSSLAPWKESKTPSEMA